ncbi:MAG: hypothetical protein NZ954_08280 [Thermofilaceae archaeon]|nr:hypothetical protein [Thermofilaceae archaeon]MDW8004910.1 hypothetical protein [Thermofilaceae archaeon]
MSYERTYVTNPYLAHIISSLMYARSLAGAQGDLDGALRELESLTAVLPEQVRREVLAAVEPTRLELEDFLASIPGRVLTREEQEQLDALQHRLALTWLSAIVDSMAQHGIALWTRHVRIGETEVEGEEGEEV